MRPENRALLRPDDVVFASHPGSGTSWIAALLAHLGVFHAFGHDELLEDRDSQRVRPAPPDRGADSAPVGLARPPRASEDRRLHVPDVARDVEARTFREPLRVIQTNQSALGWSPPGRVLLLVRDGRDAVLSLYHHLASFAGLDASFEAFLAGGDGAWPKPAASWALACTSWAGATPSERLHVLRFETCRERPLEELRALLAFLGVERDEPELERAIERSSYAAMRRAEETSLAEHGELERRGRFLRRGRVAEWREVYTPEMLATFAGLPRRALERLGYPTDGIPEAPGG